MRAERGELVSAGCALALLVLMFAFAWYEVDGIPGQPSSHGVTWTENGWDALLVIRWLMLATAVAAISSPLLHATRRRPGHRAGSALLVFALGTLTALLLTYRILVDLPSPPAVPDQKLGAVLGLASALGVALGGWESVRAARAHVAAWFSRQ